MDRRKYIRQPIELEARLFAKGQPVRGCIIRDFCLGGLFIACESLLGSDGGQARPVRQDDNVDIEFTVPVRGAPKDFQVTARVAGLFGAGMGVEFSNPGPEALHALQELAERTQRSRARARQEEPAPETQVVLSAAEATRLLASCREMASAYLTGELDALFKKAEGALFNAARDAKNNVEQNACFDAMKEAQKVSRPIAAAFLGQVLEQLENLGESLARGEFREDDYGEELALVDSQSFTDWLTVKKILEKAEQKYRDQERDLAQRLTHLTRVPIDEIGNPVGTRGLCSSFHDAMQNLGIGGMARQAVFEAFDATVIAQLGGLLEDLNALLIRGGVLPRIERPKPTVPHRPSPAEGQRQHREVAPPETSEYPDARAAEGVPEEGSPPPGASYAAGAGQPAPPAGASPGAVSGRYQMPSGVPGGAAVHGGGQRVAAPPGSAPAAGTGGIHPAADAGYAHPPGVQPGWEQAPAGAGAPPAPAGGPDSAARGWGPAPGAPAYYGAYPTAQRLLNLHRQVLRGSGAYGMEAPVLEQGAGLPEYGTGEVMDVLSTLQRDGDARLLDDTGRLDIRGRVLHELHARHGAGEKKRLGEVESDAIDVIANLLDSILRDPLITGEIKTRIRRLAVPLLKVALQDTSFFGDEAHPARQVVNRLGQLELGADDDPASSELLRRTVDPLIQRIIAGYDRDPAIFSEVLRELDSVVGSRHSEYERNVEEVVRQCEEQQAVVRARHRQDAHDLSRARDLPAEWKQWLNRAKRLQRGDSVLVRQGSRPTQQLRVGWVDQGFNNFVLVDARGHKAASLTLNEVAMQLRRGMADVADAADVPVMDRGLYSMLHELHERLAHEATHDHLTGLLNRKEFVERLGRAFTEALRGHKQHVLCHLDLDHFGLIREKCGERAAERLLQQLARVLQKHVGGRGFIARFSGDDFGMLLEDCQQEDGFQIADRQRRAIDQAHCVWKGESFPLTVSIGLVTVSDECESVDTVLEAAYAACIEAKKQGGNRIQVPQAEDLEHTTRLHVVPGLQSVARLLEENHLRLRCQRVEPIANGQGGKPHYEILLGVEDQKGETVQPLDFVHAAERQNQMPEVDRWVIDTMFRWMAGNRGKLARVGGYAINLSGHTLSDDKLIEYVLARFTETKVPPGKVVFEVTETAAIASLSTAADFIRVLKEYGCRFSLDDFGTGHSSYSYLKKLAVDFVKIDGMFVRDICRSENDLAMVKSINEIGHFMGKQTIAEYVETEEILGKLREIGVDYAQGFVIEKPFFLDQME